MRKTESSMALMARPADRGQSAEGARRDYYSSGKVYTLRRRTHRSSTFQVGFSIGEDG